MNNLMVNIFELFNYKHIGNSELHLFKSNTIDDFWLIYSGEPEFFTYEMQSKLLRECKERCGDKSLEKNLNLLCLWEVPNVNRNITARLHHLEEDLYFFKKHVLYFTNAEIEELNLQLQNISLPSILSEELISSSAFTRYKKKPTGSWEALLYRIAIKLTFLTVPSGSSGELTELYSSHSQKLFDKPALLQLDEVINQMDEKFIIGKPDALINYINQSMEDML